MTNLHHSDIAARLKRFLDRRQMPKRLEGKGGAMEDEVRALAAAVAKSAPRDPDRLAAWWPEFEAALGETGIGLWPTEREIKEACKSVAVSAPALVAVAVEFDTYRIQAARMERGEAVPEPFLYGTEAVELIRRGLVDRETMGRYRSAAFLSRRDTHGEAAALAWEADAKQRHEDAKALVRDRSERAMRGGSVPNKQSPHRTYRDDDAA